MRSQLKSFGGVAFAFLLVRPTFAIDTHLSDEAIREAYFLGQHHDRSVADFLGQYVQFLSPPESGPYIYSVTFLTPYALAVSDSNQRSFNYSAQQAELEHRKNDEIVRVIIQIQLTDSYGPYLTRPTGSRSGSPVGVAFRSSEFWKDFRVHVFNTHHDEYRQALPVNANGQPTYRCDGDGCILTGATIQFDFLAESFESGDASIRVDPPEGDPVSLDFDLASLR